ncbi:UDP-N-acetylenolpyruvoylglucosamine reductase [Shewanella sp. 10N.286.52.C2]|uniref:UDP-N-acetylmuramate dehydrogenase n=1 Tax=Shewanella sp. 10N.286.52.C2 TaxID=1880838 RepID=UPI000C84E083|nr:UDP-N-acetylmuramate dehydrogenase [Shewanella sp. 10N.286.52.C2]PMG28990.1 UDP-N-acetylenolpyruvoylglucosamine reductase [Shewanella sp. 10N.286.52.C2]
MPVSLAPHNTLALTQCCDAIVEVDSKKQLILVVSKLVSESKPMLILGGGSNVVFTDDFNGTIIKVLTKGIKVVEDEFNFILSVQAGENWHDFVEYCLENGINGLENLALIPGTVGAAPIQNIGAYGVEIDNFCSQVEYYDYTTSQLITLDADQCQFGYRDSIFKHQLKDKAVITEVEFRLPKLWAPNLEYGPLKHLQDDSVSAQIIFETVCDVRQSKLPDPKVLGNVGSFFKNPIISAKQYLELLTEFSDLVGYAQTDGTIKIAAGWLIDEANLKGFTVGRAAVHTKQALVLVNLGGATGNDICQLAHAVMNKVYDKFNINLEPEPRIIGPKGEVDI